MFQWEKVVQSKSGLKVIDLVMLFSLLLLGSGPLIKKTKNKNKLLSNGANCHYDMWIIRAIWEVVFL